MYSDYKCAAGKESFLDYGPILQRSFVYQQNIKRVENAAAKPLEP